MDESRFLKKKYIDPLEQKTILRMQFYENASRYGNITTETLNAMPTQRNIADNSSGGVGGNNEVVIPTLDSGSLYQRYISPYRFWMSRDATSGQEFSTINISYQCLEPDDIKAELATGVQRYLLTPDNYLQRYLLDNWFGQPFFPGYGWDDPILRWVAPTGSGGKPIEHIITNPIYKPPSFPPVSTDPNPPSPRPPTPWWEDRDSFPADQFGPDYIPERELRPIDIGCGRYFIDPTTGEYWFKNCDNRYFTWHPEGFWVPWGSNTTNFDFEDAFSIENPECVYRDNEEFVRQYLRGRSLEWFYDFIRNIRFAIEIGWLPPDFPIPSLQPASGEGVIITYPQYEYLINPRKD